MDEASQLIETIKRHLRAQRLTYRDVGQVLKLSEPSVKRLFASGRVTVDRLVHICQLLGLSLAEVTSEALMAVPALQVLTEEQEMALVSDELLLLVAVCALSHWTLNDIVATYQVTRPECLTRLLALDRMGLIALMPGDRIRLCVARNFDWLPAGPIHRYFLAQGLQDFIGSHFEQRDETLAFTHGMLTPEAIEELKLELRRLRSKYTALHQECKALPLSAKRGTALLLAHREWEPSGFERLRRQTS